MCFHHIIVFSFSILYVIPINLNINERFDELPFATTFTPLTLA